ncbi:lipid-binding SYLF domain-containing protein [Botrimarina hoheduenensis]|uniref:Ysc84 actin-binding domain-containing protein n=1 Tax=Botrimarina hoheduenensis TaxID=2528000 RepID=A0A5C5VUT5_9BACT|nr:lipid-binding SYLF domain-containing protein [Botrimarina hoheduenensis]TWT41409.1 hypothetical protein Pla111_31240 [Botrimarina hoheduenensis]
MSRFSLLKSLLVALFLGLLAGPLETAIGQTPAPLPSVPPPTPSPAAVAPPPQLASVASTGIVSNESRVIEDATTVFQEMLSTPGAAIPTAMLAGAEGIAIVPRVIKGGFIVGARHGRGVVIAKDAQGVWHAPIFLTLTGGNVGWQAGVQATDVILVYRTQRSIDSLLQGKLTIGADIAAAAGPVGRQAAAATDTGLTAEVYSYSRSRGLFAGVSLDGSVLKLDQAATAAYYRPLNAAGLAGAPQVPSEAQALVNLVVAYVEPSNTVTAPEPTTATDSSTATLGSRHTLDEAASIRDQLAEFSPRLFRLLDPGWQQYLSLPVEIFQESGHPSPETMSLVTQRYNAVAANPGYAGLANRPEFQTVLGLVRHYTQLIGNTYQPLVLPPPPQ